MIVGEPFLVWILLPKSKDEQMLYLTLFKKVTDFLNNCIFWIFDCQFIFKLSFMKNVLLFQPFSSNWQYCKLGTKKVFPFLLKFFLELILRESIFGTAASLIPNFYMSYNQIPPSNGNYFNKLVPCFWHDS